MSYAYQHAVFALVFSAADVEYIAVAGVAVVVIVLVAVDIVVVEVVIVFDVDAAADYFVGPTNDSIAEGLELEAAQQRYSDENPKRSLVVVCSFFAVGCLLILLSVSFQIALSSW